MVVKDYMDKRMETIERGEVFLASIILCGVGLIFRKLDPGCFEFYFFCGFGIFACICWILMGLKT